jgi:hypothetical protein
LPLSISEEDLDMIFNRILLSKREETLNRIRASADIQKSLAEEMWEEIFNLI